MSSIKGARIGSYPYVMRLGYVTVAINCILLRQALYIGCKFPSVK